MQQTDALQQEHELPTTEALLAGTLALMTGYGQALLADRCPGQRLLMARKIERNLGLLAEHPALTESFRLILDRLQASWHTMGECTAFAATDIAPRLAVATPTRLQ